MIATPRRVQSSDGVSLAVYESGDPDSPALVLMHGYPDNHTVWDPAAALLAERFHVVQYDVRGTGESDKPGSTSAYRIEHLVADFTAVIDATSPDAPVHVLGHDWGSTQAWAAVTTPELQGRITSYTSISAPSLDYAGAWLRDLGHDTGTKLRQLAHSTYIGIFQLPALPELLARAGVLDRLAQFQARGTHSSRSVPVEPQRGLPDKINGLELYRANIGHRPQPVRTTIPVQIIVPRKDPYIGRDVAVESARPWVDDLTVHEVAGGHWIVSERPDVIARLATEFIDGLGAPRPAPRPASRGPHAGHFVIVTGGARGIGRATALEYARQGADVLIADIDDVAAKETVGELRELGVDAWSWHLDVSDVDAWEAFAREVQAEHGAPDVMVNNAGIGMGGPLLGTTAADWGRVVNVNMWSVIHGSRLFAAQLVERGQGGTIVNVASAAAYTPSTAWPAYATTKAAVLMLTECLRAELACEGITVTAVCPGIVDSNIAASTVHVGVDSQTAEARREHQIASYQRRNYSPDKVARQLVRAATAGRPIVHVTPEARAMRALSRISPRLMQRLARVDLNAL
ncbi:SDR family oxidoreductase [uncultured Jatrophihabitans sp.]|uniref:SDR family oxidoreductase n=1 Tax=uncultured Jatrophihabitans sp. TaxID=1610747 RepID=UPI0035C9646A